MSTPRRPTSLMIGLSLACLAASATPLGRSRTRLDPTNLPVVPSACADGSRDWRSPPQATLTELRAKLDAFDWKARRYPTPDLECRATIELACAPDLDGDGAREFLGRLRWQQRLGPTRGKPCNELDENEPNLVRHEAILVLRKAGRPPTWQVVDAISLVVDGLDGMARARVDFVQLPDGRNGLRCKVQTEDAGAGCQVTAYWVGALIGDRLERLGEADPRFCQPD